MLSLKCEVVDLEWWLAPSSERLRLCIYPYSERWSLCWSCIPFCEEVDCVCLAKCLPLVCEVVIELALCLASKCRGCVCKERSCVLPVVLPQILSGGSLCGSPVWTS